MCKVISGSSTLKGLEIAHLSDEQKNNLDELLELNENLNKACILKEPNPYLKIRRNQQ